MNQIKHRLLNVGEIIQDGDEFLSQFGQGATVWELIYEAHDLIGRKVEHWNSALIRRPMTPAECAADEMLATLDCDPLRDLLGFIEDHGSPIMWAKAQAFMGYRDYILAAVQSESVKASN